MLSHAFPLGSQKSTCVSVPVSVARRVSVIKPHLSRSYGILNHPHHPEIKDALSAMRAFDNAKYTDDIVEVMSRCRLLIRSRVRVTDVARLDVKPSRLEMS